LLSADRPDELQDCASGQTINQKELFGSFVRGFHQIPHPTLDPSSLHSLQSTLAHAYSQSITLNPGPVHLNFPFREPFITTQSPPPYSLSPLLKSKIPTPHPGEEVSKINQAVQSFSRPLIIAGEFAPVSVICDWLSKYSVPVLCDSLSPLRETPLPGRILRYENILRDSKFTKHNRPDLIIVLGPLPTSKTLRNWMDQSGARRIIIEPRGISVDPLSSTSQSFSIQFPCLTTVHLESCEEGWVESWRNAEERVEEKLNVAFSERLPFFEGKLSHILSQYLPAGSFLQVANSMPIRDIEWFWSASDKDRNIFGNRGVNGIDGTLGTALGLAHKADKPTFLLTGDLAFLHDSNALLFQNQLVGNLTIFLINNQGGGIFEHLPIADQPEFEKCFATPQDCDFSKLCQAHGIEFIRPQSWDEIINLIEIPIQSGIRVIEIKTDRKKDKETRKRLLSLDPST
jgi:2-succinyl-5-enolpyruvyl-6-hydroxy-3-cyclohexene-1-carboxylate synthase